MLAFHERLTIIGLEVLEPYGFVLAGGYALSVNGLGNRPSEDVDLFTNSTRTDTFLQASTDFTEALVSHGLHVNIFRTGALFFDVEVTDPDTGEESHVQLGCDDRRFPPKHFSVGPVLDFRDALAGKMAALYGRAELRDYLDIDTATLHGHPRDELIELGDSKEHLPLDRHILSNVFRSLRHHYTVDAFAAYGVSATEREQIILRFLTWADSIDSDDILTETMTPPQHLVLPTPVTHDTGTITPSP